MSTETTASVSTHILDTSVGRPAEGVAVALAARPGSDGAWTALGGSATDADGRCKDLPALPEGTTHVRLDFDAEAYFVLRMSRVQAEVQQDVEARAEAQQDAPALRDSGAFFPEVAITFAVEPGRALSRTAAAQPVRLLRLPRELAACPPHARPEPVRQSGEPRRQDHPGRRHPPHQGPERLRRRSPATWTRSTTPAPTPTCLPTDTTKNTVYAFAKEHGIESAEQFGIHLARHFVTSQEPIQPARIRIEEYAWERDLDATRFIGADEAALLRPQRPGDPHRPDHLRRRGLAGHLRASRT